MNAPFVRPEIRPGMPMAFRSPAFELVRYTIECFPARRTDGEVRNWSLKQLDDGPFQSRLREALPDKECTYYAPTVAAMSGAVLPHEPFTVLFGLDEKRRIRRPGYAKDGRVACDGTFVEPSEGFLMSAGGCLLIVVSGADCCIVAHAGRDSLIDPFKVGKSANGPRQHASVVDAMVAYAEELGAKPHSLILRSFFSLPSNAFPHDPRDPEHGEANEKLRRYLAARGMGSALMRDGDGVLCLSLNTLVQRQAERLDIGHIETGLLNLPEDGDFAYTRHALPELGGAVRNLVMLRRN